MSKPHTILLIPHEGDPMGLLAEGPRGARPPVVWFAACCRRLVARPHAAATTCGHCGITPLAHIAALVLAWDGEVVPEVLPYLYRARIAPTPALTEIHALLRGDGPESYTLIKHGTVLVLDGAEVNDE
jgi:hypothetical protein